MPFPVRHLIQSQHKLVTVSPEQSVRQAIELMTEYDFSQLPVVDGEGKPLGMITNATILEALKQFGVTIDILRVADAMTTRVRTYDPDHDLFDLLDALKTAYAVLIENGEGQLVGIVTDYDTAEYFRQRAEDLMLVQDIETAVKDHILAAFAAESGQLDEDALRATISEVLPGPRHHNRGRFRQALGHYVKTALDDEHPLQDRAVEEALTRLYGQDEPKRFEQLALSEYILLLSYKDQWPKYESIFGLDRSVVRKMLDAVRETRNALAHFHGDISVEQRQRLRFCAKWLARHEPAAPSIQPEPDSSGQDTTLLISDEIIPTDESTSPGTGRYVPLASWLQDQPVDKDKQRVTFGQIEQIIGDQLPLSARQHRSWWANDSERHVQSQQWLDAGWRAYVNMSKEEVTFARIKERGKAYIDFFSTLLSDLNAQAPFSVRDSSLRGQNWHAAAQLPEEGPQKAILAFSFARSGQFRVELYIDTGDQRKNKKVFDALCEQEAEIEEAVQEALSWERLDDRRASRIALYHKGSITDSDGELDKLRVWAIGAMLRFQEAIWERANALLGVIKE
jgi:CBS domain-containing protein